MRGGDRLARAALLLAAAVLTVAAAAWSITGGTEIRLLGIRLSLHALNRPIGLGLALCALAALLHPDGLRAALRRLDALPDPVHRRLAWALGAAVAAAQTVLKLWQHDTFQTSAYDLGLYASAMYNTAHGRPFHESILDVHYLGEHFSPFLGLLAPFTWIADGAVLLLLLQCLAIGLATVAVYRLALIGSAPRWTGLPLAVLFALDVHLHRVASFDMHPVALFIPVALWMLLCVETDRPVAAALLALAAATLEESVLPGLAAALILMAWLRPRFRAWGLAAGVAVALLFLLEVAVLMPACLQGQPLTHLGRYANLGGESFGGIARAVARNPLIVPREMLEPAAKPLAVLGLMAALAGLPLLAGRHALLCVVPIAVLTLSNSPNQYTYADHYAGQVLPFLAYAAVHGAGRLRRLPSAPAAAAFAAVLLANVAVLPEYVPCWSRAWVADAHAGLAAVPAAASVCATDNLVPHLTNRPDVSIFGKQGRLLLDVRGFDYVLLEGESVPPHGIYPFSAEDYRLAQADALALPGYEVAGRWGTVILLKRSGLK